VVRGSCNFLQDDGAVLAAEGAGEDEDVREGTGGFLSGDGQAVERVIAVDGGGYGLVAEDEGGGGKVGA